MPGNRTWLVNWSGWPDLNRRPLRPERSALPSCATPRPRGTSTGTARDFDSLAEARACSRIARQSANQSASQTPNGLVRLARRQGEQGSLRTAGEPGRGPRRRAQTGGNVQPGGPVGGVSVQAADSLPLDPAVGDQGAVERQAQLPAVGMPGEQEVVAVRREPVEQSRL